VVSDNEKIISIKKNSRDVKNGSRFCNDCLGNRFDRKVEKERTDRITLFDTSPNGNGACELTIDNARSCATCQHFDDDVAETWRKMEMLKNHLNSSMRNRVIGFAKVNKIERNLRERCFRNVGRNDVVMNNSLLDEASLKGRDNVRRDTIYSGCEDLGENFVINVEECDRATILKITRKALVLVDENSDARFEIRGNLSIREEERIE